VGLSIARGANVAGPDEFVLCPRADARQVSLGPVEISCAACLATKELERASS